MNKPIHELTLKSHFSLNRSEVLSPLAKLTSKTAKFVWTDVEQKAFDAMKTIMSRETLLTYPDFSEKFATHADASHEQLGAVIAQSKRPIAFYSRKLNDAQKRYTTTERELLSVVETLKEFRNILYGQQIITCADHKNLMHKTFNTERVMRWRLIIEECHPDIRCIKGPHNVVAHSLSRLERAPDTSSCDTTCEHAECFGDDVMPDIADSTHPLSYTHIDELQQQDDELLAALKRGKCSVTAFHGGETSIDLIACKEKIVVPEALRDRAVHFYNTCLLHPGINRTEATIAQHLWWPNMRQHIRHICEVCPSCQKNKKTYKKCGFLPAKEAEADPWERVCVDLIGPFKIKRKGSK